MIEIFILLAKYLFIAYIGVFLIFGLIINLAREDIIDYKIAVGLYTKAMYYTFPYYGKYNTYFSQCRRKFGSGSGLLCYKSWATYVWQQPC